MDRIFIFIHEYYLLEKVGVMKKIFLLLISVLLLTGCGKVNKDKLVKEFVDKVEKSDSYLKIRY